MKQKKGIWIQLLCFMIVFTSYAQENPMVTGQVINAATKETLSGVSISVKNSKVGVTTDGLGKFSIAGKY